MAINPQHKQSRQRAILDAVRRAARQEQFLDVVSPEEAHRRFAACVDRSPLGAETLPLAAILGRVLAADVIAPVDAPPFDRSNVDGFAVRAADTLGASDWRAEASFAQCRSDRLRRRTGSSKSRPEPRLRWRPAASFRAAPMPW